MRNSCFSSAAYALVLSVFPAVSIGQDAISDAEACKAVGENGMVTLVLCAPGLDQEALRAAGQAVCGARMPCGAWIWDDPKLLPAAAPDRHDDLSPAQIRSAVGVWINERNELILIGKQ